MACRSLSTAWAAWRQSGAGLLRLQHALRRIVAPYVQETVRVALLHWAAYATDCRAKAHKLQRAVAAWTRACQRAAFNAWLAYADRQRDLKAAVLKVVLRWSHLNLHAGLQV
jgi:hypothetical protein